MRKISEDLLQFIWKHRLLRPEAMVTESGNQLRILNPGEWNRDAGPDFFNGQVQVDDVILSGNIELHIKASDWLKHGHQHDPAYGRVILHVVYENDAPVMPENNATMQVLEIGPFIDESVIERYESMHLLKNELPCAAHLQGVPDFHFMAWLERTGVERLEQKCEKAAALLHQFNGDYNQVFYLMLLTNFGFKVNALPMELLGRHLPLALLLRHADNPVQVEALLFGTAGLLDEHLEHSYLHTLQNEFAFLRRKYSLQVLDASLFKFSKLRPANFPHLRLAQFAALIHKKPALFSSPLLITEINEIKNALMLDLNVYWARHYTTRGGLAKRDLKLGEASAENVVVNTFAPFFFFYGKKFNKEAFQNCAMDFLNGCKAEQNRKTRMFNTKSHLCRTAAVSQGLIQLFDRYCSAKKCLSCGIGSAILNGRNQSRELNEPAPAMYSARATRHGGINATGF